MSNENINGTNHGAHSDRVRLPYGATPIGDPWNAPDVRGDGIYYLEAMDRIQAHVAKQFRKEFPDVHPSSEGYSEAEPSSEHIAVAHMVQHALPVFRDNDDHNEVIKTPKRIEVQHTAREIIVARMAQFVLNSVWAIHSERAGYHFNNQVEVKSNDAEVLDAARAGLASPAEMFELLEQNPQAGSIELAKLTHVFDKGSDNELAMRASIDDIILSYGDKAVLLPDNHRIKVKRTDEEIPMCIVSCKSDIADLTSDNGAIRIIERRTLLLRGDDEVRDPRFKGPNSTYYIDRRIRSATKSETSFEQLQQHVIDELKKPVHEQGAWLQPTTTSFYAFYTKQ